MPTPTLRPALASDAEFIYRTGEEYFRPLIEALGRRWSTVRMREKCESVAVSGTTSIIEFERQSAGYLTLEARPSELWLDALVLLPDFRGKGLGNTIVADVKREAGSQRLPVRLGVLAGNPAQAFWERQGFSVVGEFDALHVLMEGAA